MGSLQWIVGIGLGVVAWMFASNLANQYMQQEASSRRGQSRRKPDYVQNPNDRCAVCLDEMDVNSMQYLLCCHALHDKCLEELRKRSINRECPICRQPLN